MHYIYWWQGGGGGQQTSPHYRSVGRRQRPGAIFLGCSIKELKQMYEEKKLVENAQCYTVKWMKELNL